MNVYALSELFRSTNLERKVGMQRHKAYNFDAAGQSDDKFDPIYGEISQDRVRLLVDAKHTVLYTSR